MNLISIIQVSGIICVLKIHLLNLLFDFPRALDNAPNTKKPGVKLAKTPQTQIYRVMDGGLI